MKHWMGEIVVVFEVLAKLGVKISISDMMNGDLSVLVEQRIKFAGPPPLEVFSVTGETSPMLLFHADLKILLPNGEVQPFTEKLLESGKGNSVVINCIDASHNHEVNVNSHGSGEFN